VSSDEYSLFCIKEPVNGCKINCFQRREKIKLKGSKL
jgi:hypothetical protein